MDVSDVISIFAIAVPIIVAIMGYIIKSKNDEIKLLETRIEAQTAIISELKLQNTKLEINGTLLNKFFSQLPPLNSETIKREIQP